MSIRLTRSSIHIPPPSNSQTPDAQGTSSQNQALAKSILTSAKTTREIQEMHEKLAIYYPADSDLLDRIDWALVNTPLVDGNSLLFRAIASENTALVKLLLEKGADPLFRNPQGNTPLKKALKSNNAEVKQIIIEHLIDKSDNTTDYWDIVVDLLERGYVKAACKLYHKSKEDVDTPTNLEPLATKIFRSSEEDISNEKTKKIIKSINNSGLSVNMYCDETGQTYLAFACKRGNTSLVRWMLDQKLEIDHKDKKGNTPLHEACRGGYLEIVQLLIKAGAKVEVFNDEQVQPLIIALYVSKDERMSKAIVEVHPNPGLTLPPNGETLLIKAVKEGFYELMESLIKRKVNLDSKDSDGDTAVYYAVDKDDIKSLKLLAKHGADLHRENNSRFSPLTNAIVLKSPSCVLEIVNCPKFKSFIYNDGETILMFAFRVSSPEIVKVLIDSKKIDIDEQDKKGNTALHCAYLKNHSALVKILLEAGAKQQIPNKKGKLPLDNAIESDNKEMAELLISYHDDINYKKN